MGDSIDARTTQAANPSDSSGQTLIGQSLVIKGELTAKEDLVIEGKVEGSIRLEGHKITVSKAGRVEGDVSARSIQIAGSVNGNLNGYDRLEICETGRVKGDLKAPRVVLADGCTFHGQIETGKADSLGDLSKTA